MADRGVDVPKGVLIQKISGREFFDIFSPYSEHRLTWGRNLFRGQLSDFELIPSVRREGFYARSWMNMTGRLRVIDLINLESVLLREFLKHCDECGLSVQGDSPQVRDVLEEPDLERYAVNASAWPDDDLLTPLAVAQHHSLPTRLLDWTYSPFVALYFAAQSSVDFSNRNPEQATKDMSVWVFDPGQLSRILPNLQVIEMPRSISKNMAAQKGAFTLVRDVGECSADVFPQSIDAMINDLKELPSHALVKFVICGNEGWEILQRLKRMGISRASLFPGYESAACEAVSNAIQVTPRFPYSN